MKTVKVFGVLIIVLLMLTAAACGGTPNNASDDPGTDPAADPPAGDVGGDDPAPADDPGVDEITVSVNAPEGWTATEPVPLGLLFHYQNDSGASFNGKCETMYEDTLAAYVDYIKPIFEDTFDNLQWLDTRDVSIDGRDAIEISFTLETMGIAMRMVATYTEIDGDVYYFTFGCMNDDFESLAGDHQSFIDSIVIE